MQKYLLDTNICIFLLRGMYNVDKKIDAVGLENCVISEITEAELRYGAALGQAKGLRRRSQDLEAFLDAMTIIPISDSINLFAQEKVRLELAGTPSHDNFDLLIGCTAIVNDFILVTENIKDFKRLNNIKIENWINRNNIKKKAKDEILHRGKKQ